MLYGENIRTQAGSDRFACEERKEVDLFSTRVFAQVLKIIIEHWY